METLVIVVLTILIVFLISVIIYLTKQVDHAMAAVKAIKITTETALKQQAQEFKTKEKVIRKDALTRSRNVMRGQATEHLAPMMIEGLQHKDFRFMGDPLDYLVCDSSSAVSDGTADRIEMIYLLDIKTGKSQLSKVQRRIRDAVVDGRICFATYNPDAPEAKRFRTWPVSVKAKAGDHGSDTLSAGADLE